MSSELLFKPVRELAALVRTRQLSPVALTELYLDRLERLGPKYNAVVTITRERALSQARRAEGEIAAGRYRGALHGIPYGAKDLLATAGTPTTWGAAPYRELVHQGQAPQVCRHVRLPREISSGRTMPLRRPPPTEGSQARLCGFERGVSFGRL